VFNDRTQLLCAFMVLLHLIFICPSLAQDSYVIEGGESYLSCSIKYTFVGRYNAFLEDFTGTIYFDPKRIENSSVTMTIKTASVKSEHPTLDRIVRSKRLLDAAQYPEITFHSDSIIRRGEDYEVEGTLTLHGVSRTIVFPFILEGPIIDGGNRKYIKAWGTWDIPRKKFNIVWSKLLDYGGIIVGNKVMMDWEVTAYR